MHARASRSPSARSSSQPGTGSPGAGVAAEPLHDEQYHRSGAVLRLLIWASPSGEAGSGGRTAGSGAGTVTVTPCRPAWPQAVQSRTLPGGCRVLILWLASAGQVRIVRGGS